MAFIKVQKLVLNEDGTVRSGSASIMSTEYDRDYKGKSKHITRERLGKVVFLDVSRKSGIFLSPTRGLVAYDSSTDSFSEVDRNDPRLNGTMVFPEPEIHTVFGDVYLLFCFLEKTELLAVLRGSFSNNKDYERVLCHVLHGILKNGSKISCCDFMEKSFASYVLKDIPIASLGSDTQFFTMMGEDHTKMAFFQRFVKAMRKKNPRFGKGCYVDSTPLPNDIHDNPFNALCCHGVGSCAIQTRLVLVLDEETGFLVWFTVIPGNILDFSTIMNVMGDVSESLDIRIDSLVLDAGYVTKPLIEAFHLETEPVKDENGNPVHQSIIARMPAKNGYPFKALYHSTKPLFSNAKYEFIRQGHTYFGYRKEAEIFGKREYAYVYVDKDNALEGCRRYRYEHEKEFAALKDKDKNWQAVKCGYFILLSNKALEPAEMLDEYYGRTDIETVFKTSKEYLDLLPLSKWSDLTVKGKILSDIINTIIFLTLRKQLQKTGISTTSLIGKSQSLMCTKKRDGTILVEVPNKNVKALYKELKISIPPSLELSSFCCNVLGL